MRTAHVENSAETCFQKLWNNFVMWNLRIPALFCSHTSLINYILFLQFLCHCLNQNSSDFNAIFLPLQIRFWLLVAQMQAANGNPGTFGYYRFGAVIELRRVEVKIYVCSSQTRHMRPKLPLDSLSQRASTPISHVVIAITAGSPDLFGFGKF